VDLIIETARRALIIEIRSGDKVNAGMFKGLMKFRSLTGKPFSCLVVYTGDVRQQFDRDAAAVPYRIFLEEILPSLL
jgi:hypothetical protein